MWQHKNHSILSLRPATRLVIFLSANPSVHTLRSLCVHPRHASIGFFFNAMKKDHPHARCWSYLTALTPTASCLFPGMSFRSLPLSRCSLDAPLSSAGTLLPSWASSCHSWPLRAFLKRKVASLGVGSAGPNRMSGYTLLSRGENVEFNQSNRLNSFPSFQ